MKCDLWVSWFLWGEGGRTCVSGDVRVCVRLSLPGSVCARVSVCVCARAGCVCQREGALWVRRCCMLSEGMAGRLLRETGTGLRTAALPCGCPLRDLGMRDGNSRLAHLAGVYHIFILADERFKFCKNLAYCICNHKTKRQEQLSVAFSPTLACLALSKCDELFCEQQ